MSKEITSYKKLFDAIIRVIGETRIKVYKSLTNHQLAQNGNQYRIKLRDKEYFLDLLFYHRILKCLVAVELKVVGFEPEFAGKMNFYLEVLDDTIKVEDDNPSIGIILCPEKDDIEVEYALRASNKPIGVSEYRLTTELPDKLKGKIPTKEEIIKSLKKVKRLDSNKE